MIDLNVRVENKDRKFGSVKSYLVGYVKNTDGTVCGALFTDREIFTALQRAETNPEDVPPQPKVCSDCAPCPTVWQRLKFWFTSW